MAGRGAAPKKTRRRSNVPLRGEWVALPGIGWQHGSLPKAPANLKKASREAWWIWLTSWVAAHWTPEDVPGLRQVIRLYDQVERGEYQRATELRLMMDNYGISPKGQQDRRWAKPKTQEDSPPATQPGLEHYAHLRSVAAD